MSHEAVARWAETTKDLPAARIASLGPGPTRTNLAAALLHYKAEAAKARAEGLREAVETLKRIGWPVAALRLEEELGG